MNNKEEIIIATSNSSKFNDFYIYLGDDYNLVQSSKIGINLVLPEEGMTSLEENAIAKAKVWAESTGKIAIGDDTGFFIPSLNNEPGVAIRRWGGQLPEETTNEEFWKFFQEKTRNLTEYDCYFKHCVAIVSPDGKVKLVYNSIEGYLNKERLKAPYNGSGYPLGIAFEAYNRYKIWDELTDNEKRVFDAKYIKDLKEALKEIVKE